MNLKKLLVSQMLGFLVGAGRGALIRHMREKWDKGELTSEDILEFADLVEGIADELRNMVGKPDLMAKIRKKAQKVEIREEE